MALCCKLKAADPLSWETLGHGGYLQGGALAFDSAGCEGERGENPLSFCVKYIKSNSW